jgi:hypothetical protein
MQTKQSSFCPRLARVFIFVAAAFGHLAAVAAGLDFDKTFDTPGEPRQVHYAVRYTVNGQTHESETWRDRDSRILRRTDGRIETHVDRNGRDIEWHMVVLDLPRRIRTDIDRTNLLRIGQFTDWFSLSHGLSRPAGAYTLTAADAAPSVTRPVAPCRWYALRRGDSDSRICWSRQLHLPLQITDASGSVQWQVTRVDTRTLPASVFAIRDQGFVRNDANQDIAAD